MVEVVIVTARGVTSRRYSDAHVAINEVKHLHQFIFASVCSIEDQKVLMFRLGPACEE